MSCKFIVVWSNDHASGELPFEHDTYEAAERAGEDWLADMIAADSDPEGARAEYDFEVVER